MENDPIGDFTDAAQGAQAATGYLNAHGGINGHPVTLDVCPMKSSSGGDVCANTFVGKKDVAVILGISTQDNTMFPILKSAGIPVLGGSPLTPADFADDGNHWEFAGGPASELFTMPTFAATGLHIKSAVILQPAAVNGPTLTSYAKTSLAKSGVTNVKVIEAPAATSDPTSSLVQANASHPDAIFFEYNPPSCVNVMKDVTQLGITAKTFYFSSCGATQVLQAAGSAAKNAYIAAEQFGLTWAPTNPQVVFYKAAMDKAGFSKVETDATAGLGFGGAMNFYAAAIAIGADKLSGETINAYFASSSGKPNWLADTYSCANPPLPTVSKALCASSARILQVQSGGKLTDVSKQWFSS